MIVIFLKTLVNGWEMGKKYFDSRIDCRIALVLCLSRAAAWGTKYEANSAVFRAALQMPLNRREHSAERGVFVGGIVLNIAGSGCFF
jgi:hypothetical protein